MKHFLLIITTLIISVGIFPRSVFATDSASASFCTTSTYECSCTGTASDPTATEKSTTSTTGDLCNTACAKYDSYSLTCTLADGTVKSPIAQGSVTLTTSTASDAPVKSFIAPALNVQIPGFSGIFDAPTTNGKFIHVNFIGQYIGAIYNWILGAATLVAVVMMMIGGLQYVLSRGKEKYITKAKARITNAITGVVLLLLAYNIAFFIDPNTLNLKGLSIRTVSGIALEETIKENLASPGVSAMKQTITPCSATTFSGWGTLDTMINNAQPHVDPILLAAHMQQESGGGTRSINWGTKIGMCGELGPTQFMATTAVGSDIRVPETCCANVVTKKKSSRYTGLCSTTTATPTVWPPNSTLFPTKSCNAACGHCEIASDECKTWFDSTANSGANLQNIVNITAKLISKNLARSTVNNDLALEMAAYNGAGTQAAVYAEAVSKKYTALCTSSGGEGGLK